MAHTAYLTYDEYVNYGGSASQTAFPPPLEFKARKRIDYLTASRVQNMETVPDAVKLCMVCIMNMEQATGAEAQATNPQMTSFNTDGYSESYGHSLSADDTAKQIRKQIEAMLYGEVDDNGVPLLYRGARG